MTDTNYQVLQYVIFCILLCVQTNRNLCVQLRNSSNKPTIFYATLLRDHATRIKCSLCVLAKRERYMISRIQILVKKTQRWATGSLHTAPLSSSWQPWQCISQRESLASQTEATMCRLSKTFENPHMHKWAEQDNCIRATDALMHHSGQRHNDVTHISWLSKVPTVSHASRRNAGCPKKFYIFITNC